MKVSIIANRSEKSQQAMAKLTKLIAATEIEINDKQPDIVISIGGDGTLLSAFHRYVHLLNKIRFVGIHTGHLGFYTDWRDYELEKLLTSLLNDEGQSVSYPLLDVRVTFYDNKESQHFLALNECTIKRMTQTMVADISIKKELFERFRGDGLSVATPTGSTGYNKSVGGAVIHPRVNVLQMTEIASLNNRVYRSLGSPLVIANDEWITIALAEADDYLLSIDQLNLPQSKIKQIEYRIADERIHFTASKHTHFWRRVKDAFIEKSSEEKDLEIHDF
ncbi:NAD kinase [Vagococcus intermedius]|uniref:NAD kinase n=1 Tax=Vagococcus intermedius TaxID=2991418 RepID=A0AAF0CVP4_9ENTE|nr:NAD kinase [Vagococcus intermedius]WEG73701.1 NAD kinase [Vagococcus intermedius]WEG75785.1 NAD kinase [Vagococcus intermedius]